MAVFTIQVGTCSLMSALIDSVFRGRGVLVVILVWVGRLGQGVQFIVSASKHEVGTYFTVL